MEPGHRECPGPALWMEPADRRKNECVESRISENREDEKFVMTGIDGLTEDDVERRIQVGQDVVLGGIEIHAKFVQVNGDAGISIEYRAPSGTGGGPEGIKDINERLAGLCRDSVMVMNDDARFRLLEIVERDGGKERMLYRLVVTLQITEDGICRSTVSDLIDPAFGEADTGIAGRARQVRETIEQLFAGDAGVPGWDTEPESEEMFTISPGTNYPLAIKEQTEEEARRGMLEGEEFMVIEIQVIGFIEKDRGEESFAFNYVAAMNENAVSLPWMKEKIRLLSKVCQDTVLTMNDLITRRIYRSIRKTGARELLLYRLSVWVSVHDDGSPRWSIRDQIDPVFCREDSSVEKRAVEARRLAGMVMEEMAG